MTFEERNQILNSPSFLAKCRIALCDWMEYWAINGVQTIEDPDLRAKTSDMIHYGLDNLDECASKIAVLAISDASIIEAVEPTDTVVRAAVTSIMSNALEYLM